MAFRGFLTTLGLGLGAMYFMDPERGEQRRADVREQLRMLSDEARDVWTQGSDDLRSRANEMRSRASRAQSDVMHAGKGAASRGDGGMNLGLDMERPGDRLLTMGGGGLLALFGLLRGGLIGKLALLAGANYVAKGLMQKDVIGDAVGKMRAASTAGAGIEFRKAIRIEAPVEEVFAFWQSLENLPQFMSHLKEVRDLGEGRSHWVANGPAGLPVEWDAMITEMRPNRVIAWETLPGSDVYNAGRVRFEPTDGSTRVDVFVTYNPPGGIAGEAIAALFGADPKSAMDHDLLELKSLLEQGRESGMRPGYSYRRSPTGSNMDVCQAARQC